VAEADAGEAGEVHVGRFLPGGALGAG
jgi:hypothetical protein